VVTSELLELTRALSCVFVRALLCVVMCSEVEDDVLRSVSVLVFVDVVVRLAVHLDVAELCSISVVVVVVTSGGGGGKVVFVVDRAADMEVVLVRFLVLVADVVVLGVEVVVLVADVVVLDAVVVVVLDAGDARTICGLKNVTC